MIWIDINRLAWYLIIMTHTYRFTGNNARCDVGGFNVITYINFQFGINNIYHGYLVSLSVYTTICQRTTSCWKVLNLYDINIYMLKWFIKISEIVWDIITIFLNFRCCVIGLVAISIAWIPSIATFHSSQLFVYIQVLFSNIFLGPAFL